MAAPPVGCIIEIWPEKEYQVGKIKPDTKAAQGISERGPGLQRAGSVAMIGPWALLKSGVFPLIPLGLAHLHFSPFTFVNTHLF